MPPMAMAAPTPATAPARVLRWSLRRMASAAARSQFRFIEVHTSKRDGRLLCRPFDFKRRTYFRLVIAVRSTPSLATPAAPHQLEPGPPGLIGVLAVPVELKALVKALQLPFDRSVSE